MPTIVMLDEAVVLEAVRRLEAKNSRGELLGQMECFDWNPEWCHGFAARDVSSELKFSFGFPGSLTWPTVLPLLKQLADRGRLVEVKVGHGRSRGPVPLFRTVGG